MHPFLDGNISVFHPGDSNSARGLVREHPTLRFDASAFDQILANLTQCVFPNRCLQKLDVLVLFNLEPRSQEEGLNTIERLSFQIFRGKLRPMRNKSLVCVDHVLGIRINRLPHCLRITVVNIGFNYL
jgi:hypothetical protein